MFLLSKTYLLMFVLHLNDVSSIYSSCLPATEMNSFYNQKDPLQKMKDQFLDIIVLKCQYP